VQFTSDTQLTLGRRHVLSLEDVEKIEWKWGTNDNYFATKERELLAIDQTERKVEVRDEKCTIESKLCALI
jgi:hypothetical protein